jgi:hypothetical protein
MFEDAKMLLHTDEGQSAGGRQIDCKTAQAKIKTNREGILRSN